MLGWLGIREDEVEMRDNYNREREEWHSSQLPEDKKAEDLGMNEVEDLP